MTNFKRALLPMTLLSLLAAAGCRSGSKNDDQPPYVRTQNYKYGELIVKDYDEMHEMVLSMVRKARAAGDEQPAVIDLQSALKLIFSRPDGDNMVSKLVPDVRRELTGYGAYEKVIAQLAAEAQDNLRNRENVVTVRATASFILENMLGEIRPEAEREPGELRNVVRRLADADLDVGRDVRSERILRGMYRSKSPSEEAQEIMKGIEDREKAAAKAAAKAAKEKK